MGVALRDARVPWLKIMTPDKRCYHGQFCINTRDKFSYPPATLAKLCIIQQLRLQLFLRTTFKRQTPQLHVALAGPAVTRTLALFFPRRLPIFPSDPFRSWLLGVVNQHPSRLLEHGGSLACCPKLPSVRLMRPEVRVCP